MQDPPDIVQLLEAVTSFLREQVAPATTDRLSFLARVSANALDTVRREVQLGPQAQAREMQRLRALMGADTPADLPGANRLLCERIGAGQFDVNTPGLLDHLRETAADKVAIDQPAYAHDRT
jgi:hypothetical protein